MIIVETAAVPPFYKNGFVVSCPRTREGVLIDPGDEIPKLLEYIHVEQIRVLHILLTHAHIDHVTGVGPAKRAVGAPVHLHRDDLFLYQAVPEQARMFGLDVEAPPPSVDRFYEPGEVITFGDFDVRPYHTPGHCPGGVCLAITQRGDAVGSVDLFVGDTLFAGSIGRTDLPGGDSATLMASIRRVLFSFGDKARVFPGHGPPTTIGDERRSNPFLTRT
jgi:glyoxylase-like metal-dependent hydrolase (beta-lactamase superfamily II)